MCQFRGICLRIVEHSKITISSPLVLITLVRIKIFKVIRVVLTTMQIDI